MQACYVKVGVMPGFNLIYPQESDCMAKPGLSTQIYHEVGKLSIFLRSSKWLRWLQAGTNTKVYFLYWYNKCAFIKMYKTKDVLKFGNITLCNVLINSVLIVANVLTKMCCFSVFRCYQNLVVLFNHASHSVSKSVSQWVS